MLKEVQLVLVKLSSLSMLENVLMTTKLETSMSPKHRSLSRRRSNVRNQDARDCGTGANSSHDPIVSSKSKVRNQRRTGRPVLDMVHVGVLAILGHSQNKSENSPNN